VTIPSQAVETPELCPVCNNPLTYVKGFGWICRDCDV
jgi:hypothetical protein